MRVSFATINRMLRAKHMKDLRKTYEADRLCELTYLIYKIGFDKEPKLKSWSEIEQIYRSPIEEEKTAEEIEQEVTEKFENWR